MAKAKEKMVVFRCKYCIEDLKEYNPYINEQGEGITLKNVLCIEVPDEICENTTFELTPILLNKEKYYDLPFDEQVILLARAIKKAKEEEYKICVRIWDSQYARDEGLPYDVKLEDYIKDFKNPEEPAEELLDAIEGNYGRRGCAEIVAKNDDEELYFYHEEADEVYFLNDIFDFLF